MKTQNLIVRITPELKDEFERIADSKNMTVSEYIRYLMRKETDQTK